MRALTWLVLTSLVLCPVAADAGKKRKKKKKKAKKPTVTAAYTVTFLDDVEGEGYDVNAAGQVVGYRFGEGGAWVPFRWDGRERVDLGTLDGGNGGIAKEITDDGTIVGESGYRAVFWDSQLNPLSTRHTRAEGVDPRAQIAVGAVMGDDGIDSCVAWTDEGELELSGLPRMCSAVDVTSDGTVLGSYLDGTGDWVFLWKDGAVTVLGDIGRGSGAWPNAINDAGVAVGVGSAEHGGTYAWYSRDGGLVRLPSPGAWQAQANDVNDAGLVVGMIDMDGDYRAVLWKDGNLVDLNTVVNLPRGARLSVARGVSEAGHITGHAYVNQTMRAFLLTPIR